MMIAQLFGSDLRRAQQLFQFASVFVGWDAGRVSETPGTPIESHMLSDVAHDAHTFPSENIHPKRDCNIQREARSKCA
jgi:hypothetical protein